MWDGVTVFEFLVQLNILALVNKYRATALVKLGIRRLRP
jgi:hypothetical protein